MPDFLQRPLLCEHSLSFQEGGLATNACLSLPPSHTCAGCARMEEPLSCFQVHSAQPGHTMATETRGGHVMKQGWDATECSQGSSAVLELVAARGEGPGKGQCWESSPKENPSGCVLMACALFLVCGCGGALIHMHAPNQETATETVTGIQPVAKKKMDTREGDR